MHKYIIPSLAAVLVLTMFPLLFFGVVRAVEKDPAGMTKTLILAMAYMGTVLFFSFLAVQNIKRPLRGYLFLLVPVLSLLSFYFL